MNKRKDCKLTKKKNDSFVELLENTNAAASKFAKAVSKLASKMGKFARRMRFLRYYPNNTSDDS